MRGFGVLDLRSIVLLSSSDGALEVLDLSGIVPITSRSNRMEILGILTVPFSSGTRIVEVPGFLLNLFIPLFSSRTLDGSTSAL